MITLNPINTASFSPHENIFGFPCHFCQISIQNFFKTFLQLHLMLTDSISIKRCEKLEGFVYDKLLIRCVGPSHYLVQGRQVCIIKVIFLC